MREMRITRSERFFAIRKAFDDPRASHAAMRHALLIAYKAVADLTGKGSFFVITVLAARRLSRDDFGLFSLATTLGWMLGVAADFGIRSRLPLTTIPFVHNTTVSPGRPMTLFKLTEFAGSIGEGPRIATTSQRCGDEPVYAR
jgi:hypothetical protein